MSVRYGCSRRSAARMAFDLTARAVDFGNAPLHPRGRATRRRTARAARSSFSRSVTFGIATMSHLAALAQFVAKTPSSRIPPAALTRARHALIDVLGVTIAGSVEPVSKIIAQHVAATSRGDATVITGGV